LICFTKLKGHKIEMQDVTSERKQNISPFKIKEKFFPQMIPIIVISSKKINNNKKKQKKQNVNFGM